MIINISKNTVVSENFSAKTGFSKIKGLIGSRRNITVVFKTRFGIHTFFLKYPIDVIVLDKYKRAVIIKRSLKPNRFFFWNIKYDTVVELPKESVDKSKTEIGDLLKLTS